MKKNISILYALLLSAMIVTHAQNKTDISYDTDSNISSYLKTLSGMAGRAASNVREHFKKSGSRAPSCALLRMKLSDPDNKYNSCQLLSNLRKIVDEAREHGVQATAEKYQLPIQGPLQYGLDYLPSKYKTDILYGQLPSELSDLKDFSRQDLDNTSVCLEALRSELGFPTYNCENLRYSGASEKERKAYIEGYRSSSAAPASRAPSCALLRMRANQLGQNGGCELLHKIYTQLWLTKHYGPESLRPEVAEEFEKELPGIRNYTGRDFLDTYECLESLFDEMGYDIGLMEGFGCSERSRK